jgi:hypothetical protein
LPRTTRPRPAGPVMPGNLMLHRRGAEHKPRPNAIMRPSLRPVLGRVKSAMQA